MVIEVGAVGIDPEIVRKLRERAGLNDVEIWARPENWELLPNCFLQVSQQQQVLKLMREVKEAKAEKYAELMVGDNLSAIASAVQGTVASAAAISLKFPSIPQAGAGAEPEVVGHALGMAPGTVSPAIQGEVGVWAVSATRVNEAPEKTDFANEQLNLLSRARGGAYARISNAMLEAADLEDLRSAEE